jgi:hypothetical protein
MPVRGLFHLKPRDIRPAGISRIFRIEARRFLG